MSSPRIEALLFDEDNEAKFAAHNLTTRQVDQVLDNEFVVVRNRRRRRGLYLIIGRDHGGLYLSIPVETTVQNGLWRPVTAWPSKPSEIAKLRHQWR